MLHYIQKNQGNQKDICQVENYVDFVQQSKSNLLKQESVDLGKF
jgi:hypothetical protein